MAAATPATTPPKPDLRAGVLQHVQFYWALIQHEDDLVNHRLTWLLVFQTALFTFYAFSMNGSYVAMQSLLRTAPTAASGTTPSSIVDPKALISLQLQILALFHWTICAGGILISYVFNKSIRAAFAAWKSLRASSDKLLEGVFHRYNVAPDSLGNYPDWALPSCLVGGGTPVTGATPDHPALEGWTVPKYIHAILLATWTVLGLVSLGLTYYFLGLVQTTPSPLFWVYFVVLVVIVVWVTALTIGNWHRWRL